MGLQKEVILISVRTGLAIASFEKGRKKKKKKKEGRRP